MALPPSLLRAQAGKRKGRKRRRTLEFERECVDEFLSADVAPPEMPGNAMLVGKQ